VLVKNSRFSLSLFLLLSVVIVKMGGAEYGRAGLRHAYDPRLVAQAWLWFVVPGDPGRRRGRLDGSRAKLGSGRKWWINGGGGTVWDSITFDLRLDLIYVGPATVALERGTRAAPRRPIISISDPLSR